MKKFYPFAAILLSAILLSNLADAQTYTNTYTAVRNGKWHVDSGPNVWDASGEPSSTCNNCLIIINSGVTVTLNRSVILAGSSVLQIGTSDDAAAELLITASTGADWASSNNLIVLNDGSSPANTIKLGNSSAFINASSANHQFDGVFSTFDDSPMSYFRQVGTGPSAYSGTTVTNNDIFSQPTLTGPVTLSGNGTLPIELTGFEAVLADGQVKLSWETQKESNSDHFSILRSTDEGASWKSIGTVAAHGNSSVTIAYAFTDATPAQGVSEYRLQSVDKDGRSALSKFEVVRNGLIGNLSFFPNPAKDYVYVSIPEATTGSLSIRLFSQAGQLLTEKSVNNAGGSTVSLPVSNYPQGNYLIVATSADGSRQVSKLVISK